MSSVIAFDYSRRTTITRRWQINSARTPRRAGPLRTIPSQPPSSPSVLRKRAPRQRSARLLLSSSGRYLHLAPGFGNRQRGVDAFDLLVDDEEILGIVLALRLSVADKERRHELIVARAVERFVGHQRDLGR